MREKGNGGGRQKRRPTLKAEEEERSISSTKAERMKDSLFQCFIGKRNNLF